MTFRIKIKQDDLVLAKLKGDKISDFDNVINGLKEKFGEKKRR